MMSIRSRRTALIAPAAAFAAAVFLCPAAARASQPPGTQARFPIEQVLDTSPNTPESLAFDRMGNMYLSFFSFTHDGKIVKVAPGKKHWTPFATLPPGTASLGVRLNAAGNVYVAGANVGGGGTSGVYRIPAGGGTPVLIAAIAGIPNGLAFDRHGNLYVSESSRGHIYRIHHGTVSLWAHSRLLAPLDPAQPGPCGKPFPGGAFGANGIAIDSHGDLLVANSSQGTIVRIPVRRNGSAGTARNYAGPACRLWGADGLLIDGSDRLYVAANARQAIVRIDTDGAMHILASAKQGDPLHTPSDLAFRPGMVGPTQIYITNFALFNPENPTPPGVVRMMAGGPWRAPSMP